MERTILIFPEFEKIDKIQSIRKKYDPLADLILPHITLVFPFESELTDYELGAYLEDCLKNIKPFMIELSGFSKQIDAYGYYLFFNIIEGADKISMLHDILYSGKLNEFYTGIDYIPHLTVGKLDSVKLLDEAFEEVSRLDIKFSIQIKNISLEMIGESGKSIIKYNKSIEK